LSKKEFLKIKNSKIIEEEKSYLPFHKKMKDTVRVAVIQATPVFFDIEASLQKTADLTQKYARQGCELLLFPETFLPGYPRGLSFGSVIGNRDNEGRVLYQKYWESSVSVKGKAGDFLGKIAKENKVYLVIGVTEKDENNGSLYCSILFFSPQGILIGKHRKLKPTGVERLVWAEGDGSTLNTYDTAFGKIGGLICWENYMPLARMALYKKGVQIYLAPTADSRETWISTMQHIACEGRCFVLGCNQFFRREDYPEEYLKYLELDWEILCRGGSVIVSPLGEIIEGPLWEKEGVLIADLEMNQIIESKLDYDVIGHYARPDIFEFKLKNKHS
jgi:nitrilase